MDYELLYAHTPEEGAKLASELRGIADRSGEVYAGFDTEFYGVELGKQSTVARAKVHFASLAWDPGGTGLHPRGFPNPRAAVVSRAVVTECEPFRALLEDPRFYWLAHNAPVDAHAVQNEGIVLSNVINTLTMARWTWPHRARAAWGGGFGLDALGKDILGEGKLEHFNELFMENIETWETHERRVKWCACGADRCRKRTLPCHQKFERVEHLQEPKLVERKVPLEEVVQGHFLFDRALRYAAQDAVLAFALYHIMVRLNTKTIREVPWLSETPTPSSASSSGGTTPDSLAQLNW